MLITDAVVAKKFGKHEPVVLRPTRTRDAPNIAEKLDLVLPQQLEKIRERVSSMAYGVDL